MRERAAQVVEGLIYKPTIVAAAIRALLLGGKEQP
jgi:hypothetical protein